MSRPFAQCRLCLEPSELCHSHIIPEFFYTPIYGDKHLIEVSSVDGNSKPTTMQKGYREYLLCLKCEGKFQKYEKYVSRVFFHQQHRAEQTEETLFLTEIRYKETRLFFMSLLWRMGVSSMPFFAGVQLEQHEEKLRQALLSEDVLMPTDYAFVILALYYHEEFLHEIMLQPSPMPSVAGKGFRVVIAGFLLMLHTSPTPRVISRQEDLFRPGGVLKIHRANIQSIPSLFVFFQKLLEADEARRKRSEGA